MINTINSIGFFNSTSGNENITLSPELRKANSILKESNLESNSFNKVFDRVDNFFDVGSTKNMDFSDFSKKEMESFLKVLSSLMKEGIIGYEYYEVDGKVEKYFLTTSIGNRRLYNAEWKARYDNRGGWLA